MPVQTVFENLEAGMNVDEIVEQFGVTPEQVKTVLDFAVRSRSNVLSLMRVYLITEHQEALQRYCRSMKSRKPGTE